MTCYLKAISSAALNRAAAKCVITSASADARRPAYDLSQRVRKRVEGTYRRMNTIYLLPFHSLSSFNRLRPHARVVASACGSDRRSASLSPSICGFSFVATLDLTKRRI